MTYLWVFVGGGLGSIARYMVSRWISVGAQGLPWQTLMANLLSCIVLGFFYAYISQSESTRATWIGPLIIVGFCGGFSTFSTFSLENFELMLAGKWLTAAAYILMSLIFCLLGLWLGMKSHTWFR